MSNDVRTIPECHCLECGHKVNRFKSIDGSRNLPEPGDLVLCIRCGAVMKKHADDMTLCGMSDQEMDEILADTELMNELRKVIKKIHFVRTLQN